MGSEGAPLEQMEMDEPPWVKAEIREMRRRRSRKICWLSVGLIALVLTLAGVSVGLWQAFLPKPATPSPSLTGRYAPIGEYVLVMRRLR